ncbi:10403_t:CDS:10 [Funneliformis mosseae]|uniref:10403_t:CDS:1 n=1 Tax=Funneliformis mosseae TaxID=27381 RepID=A0A9N8YNX3_FUNMO|nr:10403_t:CDS:10 [Funneliformis mosseae]
MSQTKKTKKSSKASPASQEITTSMAISDLSKYYQYNCDKLLRLMWDKDYIRQKSAQGNKKYTPKMDDSTLRDALRHRGMEFESEIKRKLNELYEVIDCQHMSPADAKDVLRNVKVGQMLYQMKFDVPKGFYDEMGIKDIVKLKAFIPDFIEVKEEDGEKKLMVYDAKASKSARVPHQFQVASYAYLLEFVIKKIRGLSISRTGGIYLPSTQGPFQLQTFRMDFLLPKIERFFHDELPRIITAQKVPWHYNARCTTCEFVNVCRKDAEGSIAMIPYLSIEKAEDLKNFIQDWKSGGDEMDATNGSSSSSIHDDDVDIEDLADYFDNLNIDDKKSKETQKVVDTRIKQIVKYDSRLNSSPYLKALETKQAQFIGVASANFPQKTDHNLLISMSTDPFLSRPFGWGLCLYTSDGRILQNFRRAEAIPKNDESTLTFISLMDKFVTILEKSFEYLSRVKSRACVFVYAEQEKRTIQDALLEIISMDPDTISSAVQHTATRCLFNLFEDSSLLLGSGNMDGGDVTELPDEWREFPRLIILEQAIRENVAIHVPGFYRFVDIWQQLVKPKLHDQELLNSLEQHIEDIDLEDIYALWVAARSPISRTNEAQLLRVDFGCAVIKAYYELLKESTEDISSKLLFTPQVFTFTEIKAFKHHFLGKIHFFKQFEAVTDCARIRSARIKDFLQGEAVYGIRLQFEKFTKKDGQEWIAKFNLLSRGREGNILEYNALKEFILVEDNPEGVLEAIRFPDMKYRNKFFGYPLSVVCLYDINNSDPQKREIWLKGVFKKRLTGDSNNVYRLYKRYLDFNLDKVLSMLTEIDERNDDKSVFLDLLKDPNAWGSRSLTEEVEQFKEIKATALKLRDAFSMSPSQKEISAELLEKRLQIVWGPPGSGKTHFLALFITWYLSTVKPKPTSANANYIIGVTAFTRAAIDNLLDRISSVQIQRHKTDDFKIIRLVKDLKKTPLNNSLEECKAETLPKKLAGNKIGMIGKPVVIGGTVWDWYKVRRESGSGWAGCDIMIIDEGSQANASLAIECLNPKSGRLVVAGDHMQLGPIIQNTYPVFPPDHPLIFGSVQQCLMRREDGSVFHEEDFFLKKGQKHDFGPLTIQLRDNWRMNKELNCFFQKIYGDDYISKHPNQKLIFEDPKLSHIKDPLIQRILSPDSAITLVKLSMAGNIKIGSSLVSSQFLQNEADVVAKIASAYFESAKESRAKTKASLFIVTPHHRQRFAIQSRLVSYMNNQDISLQINTVEKMQGQEADIVISCFGFLDLNEISKESEFLFDRNRWNVAISRARCKAIVITTDEMLYPRSIEIFANKKTSEGWVFLSMVEKWDLVDDSDTTSSTNSTTNSQGSKDDDVILATPEQEVPPPPSSKKELESIATICEEATSTKQIVKKPEAPVRELTEDLKKFGFYDIPSSSDNTANNTANLFAINSPFNNIGFSGTSLSNDFIYTQTFDNSIYVFIDNSNILAGFKAICQSKLGKRRQKGKKMPMLDYIELFKIIEKGRNVKRKFLAASKPLFQPLTQAENAGYECAALQRINQREQCVDEIIQLQICNTLLDVQSPSTLVLATGDGNDAEYNEGGFYKCIKNALERGWNVEIISWKRQLNQNFIQLSKEWDTSCQIIRLDPFASKLGCRM